MKLSICNTKTDSKGRELLEHGTAFFPISCVEEIKTAWRTCLAEMPGYEFDIRNSSVSKKLLILY